jgi:hypothetical protein
LLRKWSSILDLRVRLDRPLRADLETVKLWFDPPTVEKEHKMASFPPPGKYNVTVPIQIPGELNWSFRLTTAVNVGPDGAVSLPNLGPLERVAWQEEGKNQTPDTATDPPSDPVPGPIDSVPNSAAVKFGMNWTPDAQSLFFGEQHFTHVGPIRTDPSHDLAHLIVAANGNLPWAPKGDRETIKLAEYNAVFLEHLLNNIFNSVVSLKLTEQEVFPRTLKHARWFVERHFAPFPISAEEAFGELCRQIDLEVIVGLSIYFFRQKFAERSNPDYKIKSWTLGARCNKWPLPIGRNEIDFRDAVRHQINRLKGSRGPVLRGL